MTDKTETTCQTMQSVEFIPQKDPAYNSIYYGQSVAAVHPLVVDDAPIWIAVFKDVERDIMTVSLHEAMVDAIHSFARIQDPNMIFEEKLKISAEYSMMSPFMYREKKLWLVVDVMNKSVMVTSDINEPLITYLPV